MRKSNKGIVLVQGNALTQSRYDFNVIEKRCLYQIIGEVRRLYIDSNSSVDGFKNMRLLLTPKTLGELGARRKEVFDSLSKLRKRDVDIKKGDIWVNTGFISVAKYDASEDVYEVEVSSEIMPYLVEFAENYTSYNLVVAISLKSIYSQRFYEFCCQYKNRPNRLFYFSIEDLREMMMLEDKYTNIAHFKQRVLDVAQKEIKDLYDKGECELWFEYKVKDKDKKKILSYYFIIHHREDTNVGIDYKAVDDHIQRVSSILKAFFPRDKRYINRVIKKIQLRPDIAEELVAKLDKKVMNYEKEDIPPVIRHILKEDYQIK